MTAEQPRKYAPNVEPPVFGMCKATARSKVGSGRGAERCSEPATFSAISKGAEAVLATHAKKKNGRGDSCSMHDVHAAICAPDTRAMSAQVPRPNSAQRGRSRHKQARTRPRKQSPREGREERREHAFIPAMGV